MRICFVLTSLLSSLCLSPYAFADWTQVGFPGDGKKGGYYIDLTRIKTHHGLKYVWALIDYGETVSDGSSSAISYQKWDCELSRFEYEQVSFYAEPMGEKHKNTFDPNQGWEYPPPNSMLEGVMNTVCER